MYRPIPLPGVAFGNPEAKNKWLFAIFEIQLQRLNLTFTQQNGERKQTNSYPQARIRWWQAGNSAAGRLLLLFWLLLFGLFAAAPQIAAEGWAAASSWKSEVSKLVGAVLLFFFLKRD